MSNLAVVTNTLREKDAEKTAVEENIKLLKEYHEKGFSGKLRFEITDIFQSSMPVSKFKIQILASDSNNVTPAEIAFESLGQEAEFLVKDRKREVIVIQVSVLNPDTPESLNDSKFFSNFDSSDVPEDTALKQEIVCQSVDDPSVSIIAVSKVSFDPISQLLESKQRELGQIMQDLSDLRDSVKELSSKKDTSTSSVKKSSKKGSSKVSKDRKIKKKANDSADPSGFDGSDSGVNESVDSWSASILQSSSFILSNIIEKRGIFLFGIAVVGIQYFGEYASV